MARFLTLCIICTLCASFAHAQKISQEALELLRGECVAMAAGGVYASADNKKATERCVSACPETLQVNNNRALTLCMGAHSQFSKTLPRKEPVPEASEGQDTR